jgi:type IV pilus assembly protein PilW
MPTGGYNIGDLGMPSFVMHAGSSFAVTEFKLNANNQLTVGAPGAAGTPIAEGVVSLQVRYGVGPKTPPYGGPELACNTSVDAACQRIKAWTDAVNFDGVDWSKLNTVPALMDQRLHDIMRIKAVRIAVVARSANLERDVLYGAGLAIEPKATCTAAGDVVVAGTMRLCAWADGTNPDGTASLAPRVDLSGTADWDRYRYKVYETVIPLRNVMWGSKGS